MTRSVFFAGRRVSDAPAKKLLRSAGGLAFARCRHRLPAHGGRLARRRSRTPCSTAPPFAIPGAEIEPPDPRERERGRAHRAWLERHVEIAADQPLRAELRGGFADDEDLGMGRGSRSSRVRFPALASTSPSRTIAAPTGTSPRSAAARASSSARPIGSERSKLLVFIEVCCCPARNAARTLLSAGHERQDEKRRRRLEGPSSRIARRAPSPRSGESPAPVARAPPRAATSLSASPRASARARPAQPAATSHSGPRDGERGGPARSGAGERPFRAREGGAGDKPFRPAGDKPFRAHARVAEPIALAARATARSAPGATMHVHRPRAVDEGARAAFRGRREDGARSFKSAAPDQERNFPSASPR